MIVPNKLISSQAFEVRTCIGALSIYDDKAPPATLYRQQSGEEQYDLPRLRNGGVRNGTCAATKGKSEVSAPNFVVGLSINGAETFAPNNIVCTVHGAVAVEIAGKLRNIVNCEIHAR